MLTTKTHKHKINSKNILTCPTKNKIQIYDDVKIPQWRTSLLIWLTNKMWWCKDCSHSLSYGISWSTCYLFLIPFAFWSFKKHSFRFVCSSKFCPTPPPRGGTLAWILLFELRVHVKLVHEVYNKTQERGFNLMFFPQKIQNREYNTTNEGLIFWEPWLWILRTVKITVGEACSCF